MKSQYENKRNYASWKETERVFQQMRLVYKETAKCFDVYLFDRNVISLQIYPREEKGSRVQIKKWLEKVIQHIPPELFSLEDKKPTKAYINPVPFVNLNNIESFFVKLLEAIDSCATFPAMIKAGNDDKKVVEERIDAAEKIVKEIDELNLEGKEKEMVVKTRVNQGEFRTRLLHCFDKCCLCGLSSPDLLIASHIKPWSHSEPAEKLDPNNGLLLCPNHDKLFDGGYISFNEDGEIQISNLVSKKDREILNIREGMKISINDKQAKYLTYHRENIYKK